MKKLSKKQEILYGFAGFGPNLLMIIITAYIIDAFMTKGFSENIENWTFANKTIVMVGVFSILVTIAKIIDGVIDIPLAWVTNRLKTKWGKRRPAILIGLIPMILAYIALCNPPSVAENSALTTIWTFGALIIFFSSYTLCLLTYYATFAEITENTRQRVRLSHWKSIFDTISYSIAYALIPLLIGFDINIKFIALGALPLIITMIIPIFVIKEPSTRKKDLTDIEIKTLEKEEAPFMESLKVSFSNKKFMLWMLVFGIFYFGLQMFLAGQNVLASGPMGLDGWKIAVMNSAAFAPVPIMLIIYNKVMKKRGFLFAFKTAILSFAFAMSFFAMAYVGYFSQWYIRFAFALTGSTIGSYGIGAFFAAPYLIPSQLAVQEKEATGKNYSAMFFAVQGFIFAIIGALSTGLVWINLRNWSIGDNHEFGTHMMTFVVCTTCIIAFILAFFLPKSFNEIGYKKEEKSPQDL